MKSVSVIFVTIFLFLTSLQKIQAQLIITEVYPAPLETESEWIEVFNQSDTAVQLNGFQLYDQYSSPSLLHTFSNELLEPNHYTVITLSATKLNNTQDEVKLFDTQGIQLDSLAYSSAQSQMSFSKTLTHDGIYSSVISLTQPTRNGASIFTTPQPTPIPTSTPTPQATSAPTATVTPNIINAETDISNLDTSITIDKKIEPPSTQSLIQQQQLFELLTIPSTVVTHSASDSVRTVQRSYLTRLYVSDIGVFSAIIGGLLLVCAGLLT